MSYLKFTDCVDFTGNSVASFDGARTYVSTGALDCDHIDYSQTEEIDYATKPSRANLKVSSGDVIFAKMMATKKTLRIDSSNEDYIYSTGFCSVRPKEGVLTSECLYHLLTSELFLLQKDKNSSGATQKAITNSGLSKVVLNVPNISVQRQIATQLNGIDQIIDSTRRQLLLLDELVKSRFIELFGDVASNPNGYPVKNFEDMSVLITDGEHATPRRTEKGIYLLSARNVLNHMLQLDDVDYIDEEEYNRIARRVVPQVGDVLISCSGSIGRCCVVPEGLKFQMVRSAALIRFDDTINPIFAEWLITSDDLQQQIAQSATQSSQANLFQGKIRKLHGYVPPLALQNQFAAFVEQTDKSKLAVQQSLEKLETLKKALMQKYFG